VLRALLALSCPECKPPPAGRALYAARPDPHTARVADCCNPRGCDSAFTERFARRTATRYRKHGLDRTAQRLIALLEVRGVQGATVLEVGGGVGHLQIELLKRGATHATNLELSPSYEQEALALLDSAGLTARVDRRIIDIAADPGAVAAADIVIAHRVVCCYPDYEALLSALATHAGQQLVFSHPPRNLLTRAFIAAQNLTYRLRGSEFRVFTHPPATMLSVLRANGLRPVATSRHLAWHVELATR
jgi:16S rRNA G966 N2-methylase RsmD